MLAPKHYSFPITAITLLGLALTGCGADRASNTSQETKDKPVRSNLELATLSDEELTDGWISLFDGQTLFGWKAHSEADWQVVDKTIQVTSGEKGLLCTTTQFDNYILKVDFRADPKTNSGIFLRTEADIGPDDVTTRCYELNIAPSDNPFPTGSLVKRQKVEGDYMSDDWQAFEVRVDGPQVVVNLNGEEILSYEDPQPIGRGLIGLQHNEGEVAFRNIKLKPLGLDSIFNGKNLDGWKTYPDMDSEFSATDEGWLNVKNGRGQLETEESYGDFILQFECISNAPNLNSGIFFRCIPGDVMMGYESQIHNEYIDGERTAPVDCGTGGIFKRQDARIVAADDLKWFHNTIIADGPHFAIWVNGMQVTDWTDTREPNENPRRGLREEPGTIMIQGHDPTTDLSFRNMMIVEQAK